MNPTEIFENLKAGLKLQVKGWHPARYIQRRDGVTYWDDGTKFTHWDSLIDDEWQVRGSSFLEVMAAAKPFESVKRKDWPPVKRMYINFEGQWELVQIDCLSQEDINAVDWEVLN